MSTYKIEVYKTCECTIVDTYEIEADSFESIDLSQHTPRTTIEIDKVAETDMFYETL